MFVRGLSGASTSGAYADVSGTVLGTDLQNALCDWVPFLYKSDYCHIPTPAELAANPPVGPAMTADNVAQLQTDIASTLDALMASTPADAANYQAALNTQSTDVISNLIPGGIWTGIAIAAVSALVLFSR
jgi:hypothetical protein